MGLCPLFGVEGHKLSIKSEFNNYQSKSPPFFVVYLFCLLAKTSGAGQGQQQIISLPPSQTEPLEKTSDVV